MSVLRCHTPQEIQIVQLNIMQLVHALVHVRYRTRGTYGDGSWHEQRNISNKADHC